MIQSLGDDYSPLHLTALMTLQANSEGAPNTLALVNPSARPMEIHAVKWQLASGVTIGSLVGGLVSTQMSLGEIPLTNGFVPLWNFGKADWYPPLERVNGSSAARYYVELNWKLGKPLYVPSGSVVTPRFKHSGLVTSDIDVRVSYVGRNLPLGTPPPQRIEVPYAASWVSKTMTAAGADTDSSSETDLANPFTTPVQVERMTGRATLFSSNGGVNYEDGGTSSVSQDTTMLLRIASSRGDHLVRDPAPLRAIFPYGGRSWECPHTMDPRVFYRVFLTKNAIAGASAIYLVQAMLGLVGRRQLKGDYR